MAPITATSEQKYAPKYPDDSWPLPVLSLKVEDLAHPGVAIFFQSVNPLEALRFAVMASFQYMYLSNPAKAPSNVKTILLVLRPMPGVAYTTGVEPDGSAHKEIHFSADHIVNSSTRSQNEIMGVLTHEVVHCYQYDCGGTAPGGLIEGFADYVRLRSHLNPPHWSPVPIPDDKWNSGYERTGFFLYWLEERYGDGTVAEINHRMHNDRGKWEEKTFKKVTGRKVKKLWEIYCAQGGGRIPPALDTAQSSNSISKVASLKADDIDDTDIDAVLVEKSDVPYP